jgi:putative tail protein
LSRQVIEERLIKLGIDNEQFKKGLKESLSSLEALDKGLSKSDGKSSFTNIEKSAKNLSKSLIELMDKAPKIGDVFIGAFDKVAGALTRTTGGFGTFASSVLGFISPVSSGTQQAAQAIEEMGDRVEQSGQGFSFLQSIATVALGNIAASAVQAGLSIATNLGRSVMNAIAPVKQGFGQFEDKINSVNMLVAALGRSEMGNITDSLDDLQKYAETTKYSVKQMHGSLAQFVNAGVGLKESTTALKGWGNLAASAGASTDGFNRSLQFGVQQALQMGKMNTQNWVSVENAGMATQRFKDILLETAQALGQDVDMSEGFRNSLQQGWLTNEVLIKSLETLANDETLSKMAEEFHTLGEVSEAVADQVTSVWARFWETLIGQAGSEEVTAFWTKWGNLAANALSKAGNQAVEFAKSFVDLGGRQKVIQLMETAFNSLSLIIKPIGEAFRTVFGDNHTISFGQKLIGLIQGLTEKLKIGTAESEAFKQIFQTVFGVIKWILAELGAKLKIIELLIPDHMFKNFVLFLGMLSSVVSSVIRTIETVISKFINFEKAGKVFDTVANAVHGFWAKVNEYLGKFAQVWMGVFDSIPNGIGKVIDFLKKFGETILLLIPGVREARENIRTFFAHFMSPFKILNNTLDKNYKGFNDWAFGVGNAMKRFPVFGKMLGDFVIGFSDFNKATHNMSSSAGQFGNKLRQNLNKMSSDWTAFSGTMKTNYKTFWAQFNANMDGVINGQIRSWKDFNKNLNWGSLIPSNITGMFKGLKFDMPDTSKIKSGLASFASNPFESISKGSAGLSKWLENSTFSFQSLGNVVRKTWPSLGEYADKLDKVQFSFSFLKPIVDAVGQAFEWLSNKLANFSIGNFKFSDLADGFKQIQQTLSANFADGFIPGIVKSIDGFRKWAGELGVVKLAIEGLTNGKNLIGEMTNNIKTELGKSKVDFTNYKTTLKTFGGWFSAFWKGLGETVHGPTMTKIFDGFKNTFSGIIDWFKSTFGPWFKQFFGSLPEDVQKFLIDIWNNVKKFSSDFSSNFKGVDFSFKNFGDSVKQIGDGISKTFSKIIESVKDVWDAFTKLFGVTTAHADDKSPLDFGQNDMKKAKSGINELSDDVDHIHNKTQGIFSTIGDMAKLMANMFSEALKPFTKENSESIGRILTLAAAIAVLWNTRKRVLTMKDMFGDFFKSLTHGPKTVVGSLTAMFGWIGSFFRAKARLQNIKAMAIAIGVLVASLWLLSTIPADKLLVGLGGLAGVLVVFEIFYLTLSRTTKKFNPARVRNMQQAMLGMLGIAGSILLLTASVALLGNMDWKKGLQGIIGVSLLLAAMFTSMAIMNKLQGNTVRGTQKIAVTFLTFVGIAYAIRNIVPSIAALGKMNFWALQQGLFGMVMIVAGITAVILATSKMQGTKFASVFAFSAMASAIKKMGSTIEKLGEMKIDVLAKGGAAVLAMLGVMAAMTFAFGQLDNTKQSFAKNAFVMFGGMILLFKMMSELAGELGKMPNPDTFMNALGGITIVVGLFSLLAMKLGDGAVAGDGTSRGIRRLGVIAAEVVVAAFGLFILSQMNTDLGHVVTAVVALGAVMLGFIGLAKLSEKIKKDGLLALGAIVGSVVVAALGMQMLTQIPVDDIWTKVGVLGAIVAGLAVIGGILGNSTMGMAGVAVLAGSFLLLGLGVKVAADALAGFLNAATGFIQAMNDMITTTSKLGAEGGQNVAKFFKEAAKGADDMGRVAAGVVTGIVVGFIEGVEGNIGRIIQVGVRLLGGFLEGILSMSAKVAETLVTIAGEAVIKLTEAMPGWFTKFCDAFLQGMLQVAQWIRNNKNVLVMAGLEMVEALTEVILEGLRIMTVMMLKSMENIPFIGDKVKEMTPKVDEAFKAMAESGRKALDDLKDYPSIATEDGIKKAIETMDALGPEEAEAARRFAASGKDGLDTFRIYCSQLGIQGPEEFIKGLQNGSISAQEAGKLLAKMAELGMTENQIKYIAEAAGFDYANGVLTAKEKAKESGGEVKKAVEEGLSGDGQGFDTGLISSAFTKLNEHMGGQLDVTKALAGVKTGKINQEMIDKLASGDFAAISQENMDEYMKPVEGMGDKAATAVDDANTKVGASMDKMSGDVNAKATTTQQNLNTTLGNFAPGINLAGTGMTNYSNTIGNGKTTAESSAKTVADTAQKAMKFDGKDSADKSVTSYANNLKSDENKGKASKAAGEVNKSAQSGLKGTGTAANSGEAITKAFAGGLASQAALKAVDEAMAKVNSKVKHHQPQSPAKEGVFSGDGWRGVFRSGLAIVKEFAGGLGSTKSMEAISSNMDKVNEFVQSSMETMTGYLDENMDMNPTITPVLDTTNLDGYNWSGVGSLNLTSGVNYSSLNPATRAQASNRYSIDEVVKGLNALDRKLETLAEVGAVGNELLAQDRISPVFMDKDLVNRALAPGMADAQRFYNDRLNMLDGVLPTI